MAILLPLLLMLQALPLEAATGHPMSVREVMENNERLDGREIVVSGWVEECRPLSCPLYASRREAHRNGPRYWLSIGSSSGFDAFARDHAPGRVTLRARFRADCVNDPSGEAIAVCADRVNSLSPVAIVR
ncbi:MAG: hypothetical protein AB7V46_13425 [Thermomicrobiales bacterium]